MGASAARDEGLRRVSGLTRAVVAGAVVVTGGFTALVARSLPGKSGAQRVSTTDQPPATPDAGGGPDLDQPAAPPTTATPASPSTPRAVTPRDPNRFSGGTGSSRPLLPAARPPRAGSGSGRAVSGSS